MIRISNSTSSGLQYRSTINHTGSNTAQNYTIIHNLGTKYITVDLYDTLVENTKMTSVYDYAASATYGYVVEGLTENSCVVRIWQWYPSNGQYTSNKTVDVVVTAL